MPLFSPDEQRQILRGVFVDVCIATRYSPISPDERARLLEELARQLTAGLKAIDRGDTSEVALTLCRFQIMTDQYAR